MKKRDSEGVHAVSAMSVSSGNSRGSERRRLSRFSLRRLFYPGVRTGKSKSRISLDSDSGKSEMSLSPASSERDPAHSVHLMSKSVQTVPETEHLPVISASGMRECPLCLIERPVEDFPEIMTCHHRSCSTCLQTYLKIEITESRINISCPECTEKYHPNDIRNILQNQSLMDKYEDFMVRRVLVSDPDVRWCPAPDCGYAVIAAGCAGCPKIHCGRPGCDTYFCYHCKQYWHPNKTCDAARAERSPNIRSASISYGPDSDIQNKDDIKPCPRCGAFIMKMNDGSCNHMACPVCGAEFCWLCMKEISDLHYLSPSGCTFWGKKPWSRKKKILWQLGTLVGAPVGITLIAGIAVPAMIIGIPVWVGRKIYSKYELVYTSKHKRNLAITGGVAASIIVAPVVAGLTVAIGVPILLAYVYGVVPISLCRSGGCGVTTSGKGGVRFEFDEDNETAGTIGQHLDNQSVGTGHNVANPSIGPSIGDASLGMTSSRSASGSHLERIGIIRDEGDTASTRAIGGMSLNGSICEGASLISAFQSKLEVQADVSSNLQKRNSFSSGSANFSIGEKSGTVSIGDNASTKALAGSIAGYRDKDNSSIGTSPYEVQVDVDSTPSPEDEVERPLPERPRNHSGQSSPVSGCSVRLSSMDDHKHKCRRCKRSVASDRCSEQQSVHFSDRVSLQNFQTDEIVSQSLNENSEEMDLNEESVFEPVNNPIFKEVICGKTPETFNDHSSAFEKALAASLPEVESDKPVLKDTETARKAVSTTALITQQDFKGVGNHRNLSKSKSHEDCAIAKQKQKKGRIRHHSCEIAMNSGRISPSVLANHNNRSAL